VRRAWTVALAVSLLSARFSAAAEDESPLLFQRGRAAMKSGDCKTAVQLLGESQALDPAVGTALNLAICEEKLGKLQSAIAHFEFVIDRAPESDTRRTFAEKRVSDLEARVAWLSVELAPGQPSIEVLLDGEPLDGAARAKPVRLDPGLHELALRDSARILFQERLNLREGERRVWAPQIARREPSAPREKRAARRAPARPTQSGKNRRPDDGPPALAYVSLGVGTAALATSLILGVLVMKKKDVVESHCDPGEDGGCDEEGVDAADAGKTLSTFATISGAIAVPALGVGAYLLIAYEPPKGDEAASAASLRLVLPTN